MEAYAAHIVANQHLKQSESKNVYHSYDNNDSQQVSGIFGPGGAVNQESFHMEFGMGQQETIANKWGANRKKSMASKENTAINDVESPSDDDSFKHIGAKDNLSQNDATEREVKRNNLIDLFLRGTEMDDYLAAH